MDIYFAVIDGRPAFLVAGVHETPPDAVPISAEEHAVLLAGQALGQEIVAGEDGRPALREPGVLPPGPPPPLTARQLRLWLLSRGITPAMVSAALETLPEPEQAAAGIEWEYSTQYLRTHPLFDQIGAAFDLTPEQIDAAWPEAAAL